VQKVKKISSILKKILLLKKVILLFKRTKALSQLT
jgi:hypothetical protein